MPALSRCHRGPPGGGVVQRMSARFDFEKTLAALRGADPAQRDQAAAALSSHGRLGLNTVEALRALQAAADPFPPRSDGRDTACELLWAAGRTPRRVYVPVVEEAFARYGAKARLDALRLLLRIGDLRSTEAWLALATRHAAELSAVGMDALLDDPRHLEALFPAVLALLDHPALAAEIGDATCALCADGELPPERLLPGADHAFAAEDARRARMAALRGAEGAGWERQEEYLQERSARSALLDLVGWLPGERAEQVLRVALAEPDRRVKAFAIAALVRRKAEVDPRHLAELAADLELRGWLRSRLAEARRLAGLPDQPEEG